MPENSKDAKFGKLPDNEKGDDFIGIHKTRDRAKNRPLKVKKAVCGRGLSSYNYNKSKKTMSIVVFPLIYYLSIKYIWERKFSAHVHTYTYACKKQ